MAVKIGTSNPWTEYIKFLPTTFNLPTFWSEEERELLAGTSLEHATSAKMANLDREFLALRESTMSIKWCQKYWWDAETGLLSIDDWKVVDAIYRSRAMELPVVGLSMVPVLDMCNHASDGANVAYYDADSLGNGILVLEPEKNLKAGDEITITYGDDKGACEMLFSYGFIEPTMNDARSLFLDLDIPEDDPLRIAKRAAFDVAPGFRIYMFSQAVRWTGPFVWLSCINEEDGLELRIEQTLDGERELTVSWKDEPVANIEVLENQLRDDRIWEVFQLRAYTIMQDRIQTEIDKRLALRLENRDNPLVTRIGRESKIFQSVLVLQELEWSLLTEACEQFRRKVCDDEDDS